ncbi:MAG: Hsp20/alpha crystallin family protein [Fibrobacteria bacterium]|nr:Hsp20/alpha crystallin family protein [Fibrobacteria bacterium]
MTLTTNRTAPTTLDNFFDNIFYTKEDFALTPRARVWEKDDNIAVHLELPGVSKEDIKVEVKDNVLSISAAKKAEKVEKSEALYINEISYGDYNRSFKLSDEVKHDSINAEYKDGVLKLTLTKKEKEKPKTIAIK